MKLFAEQLTSFPDPVDAGDDGLVDMSDDLSVERLLEAYSFGIYPWPHEGLPTLWFSPLQRGILEFGDLHVSRSLEKFMRSCRWRWTLNAAFEDVVRSCAEVARGEGGGTWITEKLLQAYIRFHHAGYAHSLEVWKDEKLVGGLYGTYVAGAFGGESMFHLETNASKFALVRLKEFLASQGISWIDTQMVTPVVEQFGGRYIPRNEFLERLQVSKSRAKAIEFKI